MKINKACSVFLILMLLAAQIFLVSEPLMASALTLTAPLGFSADVFQGYVSLNWTDNSEAFSYTTVERSLDQGNYTPIATLYKGTTVYKDYSLTNGHVYTYRARTYSNGVYSPYTNEKEVIYVYPTGLSIARTLSHSVDLEWTFPTLPLFRPMPYETLIERRLSSDTSWTTIYTAPAGETHFRDETVNADSTYYYRIRTKLPNGTSSFIPSEYGISTRTAYPLETRLSGFALSDTQIKLEWDASMLNGGRVYLQKKDAAGNFYIIFNSDTESSYVDTTVAKGKTYSYRLYVTSKNGTSSEYTTEAAITVEQVPGPSDPAVVAMPDNRAVLSWAYPYEVETGFEVWRKDSGYWDKIASLPKNTVTYTDTGIEGGKAYSYKLRAMRGETSFSTFTQAVTVNNTTPQEPKKPICVALQGFLTIYSAENVPANSVYTLEYRTDLNGEWKDYKSASQGPLTAYMSYNASSQFDFRLRANVGSLYVYSPVYHFYGSVPEKVQDVKVPIAGYERVILTWRDTTSKEESFHIYRTVKGNRELIGMANVNEERFIDDTPASGETCRYEVVPYNACGESASVATTIKVPKIVLFKDISSVSWAHDAIYKLLGLGALSGSQTNFYPNGTLSRGEFTHMALRAFGITYLGSYSFTLSDASPAHPYYEDLMNAVALGLAAPDAQGRILPNQPITRGEIAILLSNILNQLGKPLTSYAADTLEGYKDAETLTPENTALIASLVGDGIITGRSGQLLGLGSKATRVEAAAIVYRALEKYVP